VTKQNCWEIKKCGRQAGGNKVKELGECIAAKETRVNGVHGGKNGGRVCYALAGTLCGGKVQGTYASKLANCMQCEVYKLILKEENTNHKNTTQILALIEH
jgi:hypothetical protein